MTEKRYHKLIQLYRIIFILLVVGASVSGAISWIITKSFSSVYITLIPIITLSLIAYGFYNRYSINIFKRNITVAYSDRTERELVYSIAFGLYGVVIAALMYSSVFILLNMFDLPAVVVAGVIFGELVFFCAIGYLSSIRLRRTMDWLSSK
ncbi:MAG: hypothetical protein LBI79_11220 [Nitrososphaerota archaeon]|jgi:uncharacterized membrane protein YfcA|nr:hypothetical protein [Nitrososphaerota archaeon]